MLKIFNFWKIPETNNIKGVYFIGIKSRNGIFKIGKSINCLKRIKQLQTGNPDELYFYRIIVCDNHTEIETKLHRYYKKRRLRGEWFKISKKEIDSINEDGSISTKKWWFLW